MDLLTTMAGNQVLVRGRNSTIGNAAWEELYDYDQPLDWASVCATAAKLDITSTSASDAAAGVGARTVRIFGLDANWNPITEDIALNGQTAVTTVLSYLRVQGIEVQTVGSSMTNVGDIHSVRTGTSTWTAGTPNTLTSAMCKIPAGYGRGVNGMFSTPAGSAWRLRAFQGGARAQATTLGIFIQPASGVLYSPLQFDLGTSNVPVLDLLPYSLSVKEKTDVRMRVISAAASGICLAMMAMERV